MVKKNILVIINYADPTKAGQFKEEKKTFRNLFLYNVLMSKNSIYAFTYLEWKELLSKEGAPAGIIDFWVDGIYKNRQVWEKNISPKLVESLQQKFDFSLPAINKVSEAQDGTIKFLVGFPDGTEVETVLIPFRKRFTVCLSSQVGCGMNCSFCYTGTQGLKRNLTASEIIGQYLLARDFLKGKNKNAQNPNIVFMGQGEPLHNFTELERAIHILTDKNLVDIGRRQITLSTVGHLPGLKKLKESKSPRVNLALSLHSPFHSERTELIPVNQHFPLPEVIEAMEDIAKEKSQFITYEYLLIKDFNMSDEHVRGLKELLSGRKAMMNLIPFNPFPGSKWERPSKEEVENFKNKLIENNVRVLVRTTKGSDILAACGQLKVDKLARKNG